MAPPPPTGRLAFRELRASDLDFVSAMLADPEVMRYYPKPLSREEAAAWIDRQLARYELQGHALWLVSERAGSYPVGQVGLITQAVDGGHEPEIGYLLHRSFWHHGYATEAAAAVRDHAFGAIGYAHVVSLVRPVNGPSQAVARRIGMTPRREVLFAGLPHLVFRADRPGPDETPEAA